MLSQAHAESQEGAPTCAPKTAKQHAGFFEVSIAALEKISSEPHGSLVHCAYIVLNGGIDKSAGRPANSSTHGCTSIRKVTGGMKGMSEIKRAVLQLQELGLARPVASGKRFRGDITFEMLRSEDEELIAISQCFLGRKDEFAGRIDGRPADLSALLNSPHLCDCADGSYMMTADRARIDALHTFAHLHAAQDFGAYAGVDPACVSASMIRPRALDNPLDREPEIVVNGAPHLSAMFRQDIQQFQFADSFVQQVFGPLATTGTDATPLQRLRHALKILESTGLVYYAYVLWEQDPRTREGALASPVATLAVPGSWFQEQEQSAQIAVDTFLSESHTVPNNELFQRDHPGGKYRHVFEGSGIYRYVAPRHLVPHWTLLKQLRCRWWALTQDNKGGLAEDQRRIAAYSHQLSSWLREALA